MNHTTYDQLTKIQKNLLSEAKECMKNSYAPYSNFSVGAALLTHNNTIVTGTNFENAAYGSTICAERTAILKANSMGHRRFKAIAIIGSNKNIDLNTFAAPCGSCRQVLYEASQIYNEQLDVIMSSTKMDKIIISPIEKLLPLAFGPTDLGIDTKKYQT
jgi:cytidine deaminase